MDLYNETQKGLYDTKVQVSSWASSSGKPMVTLNEYAGSMSYQFAMSPELARELAGKLLSAANSFAEPSAVSVAA